MNFDDVFSAKTYVVPGETGEERGSRGEVMHIPIDWKELTVVRKV